MIAINNKDSHRSNVLLQSILFVLVVSNCMDVLVNGSSSSSSVMKVNHQFSCRSSSDSNTINATCNSTTYHDDSISALPSIDESTQQQQQQQQQHETIFDQLLAEDYEGMDSIVLPNCIDALKQRKAHLCWHKHSTFLQHLLGVHNILRLWEQGPIIGRLGLFHSAYSNSYVNLALFDPTAERTTMQQLIGSVAENLVYLFCIIDRQDVVVNTLLRQGYIPKDGLRVPHLRTPNETVNLSAETLHLLVVFSMADTSDQYFGWQDTLFGGGGRHGSMILPGHDYPEKHNPKALWPGISKPGLWMSYVSDLGKVARTYDPSWGMEDISHSTSPSVVNANKNRNVNVPPVFDFCTKAISMEDERIARDLYWSVVVEVVTDEDEIISTLKLCIEKNPWIFEPLVLLSQIYAHRNDYDNAVMYASQALTLQQQWGTAWDKRLSFAAWVSWTRVILQHTQQHKSWPTNSWEVNNFGFVQ